jgi:hypothetical protein
MIALAHQSMRQRCPDGHRGMNLEMLLEMLYNLLFCEAAVSRLKDLQVLSLAA